MDIAYELATYICNAGFGTLGDDVFVDQMPSETNGLYVESVGGAPNMYTPITEGVLDIYAKGVNAGETKGQLITIKNYIHRMHTTETNGSFIFSILAIGDVENIGRDLEYSKVYKLTVSVLYRDTALIS